MTHPILGSDAWRVIQGDALDTMRTWPDGCVDCVVTSPPYWNLRDYGVAGQVGLESSPEEYVAKLVAVFAEVRRVMRDDATLWLNLGDSYAASQMGGGGGGGAGRSTLVGTPNEEIARFVHRPQHGLKPKDLCGIPWRVAFALQADGWWLRSDIIWAKRAPMPESVTDRPTRSHEYVFLLSKSARYYFDQDAVMDVALQPIGKERRSGCRSWEELRVGGTATNNGTSTSILGSNQGAPFRNIRDVWTLGPEPFAEAHFAVMPTKLVEPCIKAGSRRGGVVLDPFAGAGTVGVVCRRLDRRFIGTELSPTFARMARKRIASQWKEERETFAMPDDAPLFAEPQP